MQLATKQLRMFPRIQRKYNVSVQFLKSNSANIRRFLWYIMSPRSVITTIARRKVRSQRVVINYGVLRRAVWHQSQRQRIKLRKRSVQQWSKRMVMHLRVVRGVHEYVEESLIRRNCLQPDEVSKQLKEQLELLRSGKRNCMPLIQQQQEGDITASIADESITDTTSTTEMQANEITILSEQKTDTITTTTSTPKSLQVNSSSVLEHVDAAEKSDEIPLSISGEGTVIAIDDDIDNGNQIENCFESVAVGNVKSAGNFLDMLMSKVGVGLNVTNNHEPENESSTLQVSGTTAINAAVLNLRQTSVGTPEAAQFTDSSDEFLGFDEDNERLPGMLMTPRVPAHNKSKTGSEHVAFISESLDEYMRENSLATGGEDEASTSRYAGVVRKVTRKYREANHDGLVTPECKPPPLEMPAVPESLQRLRTVAERRQYLQRFSKNHKLAIINNEAMVYRELQRKMKPNKLKCVSQQLLQAIGSQMPFTRAGWQAAAFVTTEYNRYYYQKLEVYNNNDAEPLIVKLPGVRGNNEELYKKANRLNLSSYDFDRCPPNCIDALLWRDFKPIKTVARKAKLNKAPLTSVFKPCPLSQKPFQKPLDDETAALLLAGGSMAVVRMPVVELEVFPQIGKPLHEIAKRYLQYILPHHDITREWAEFSVSTLQQPHTMKEAEAAAAEAAKPLDCGGRRKSFTFAIPYLNDRNQILVRRVVDRSEKLDQSFELAQAYDDGNMNTTTTPLLDLSFRANVDVNDEIQMACADVVSDMINCVAISCSENSFIKDDPDNIYAAVSHNAGSVVGTAKTEVDGTTSDDLKPAEEKCETSGKTGGTQHKKQNRLLMELRRLNATIIDAATKAEKAESKPCQKPYCALGCICSSLTDDMPLRQHCGKSKCVIECSCKHSNQGRVMRLETDGRSITTEDAFMLRRKATARLARMEKEFTSTIVLTENETLLINESQYDKKRRCTKAPKRYEDFADTDDDYTRITPPKKTVTSALVSIEAAVDTSSSNTCFTDCATELREPIFVRDTVLNELKHCSVVLSPLEDTKNMAVWCMVHELYKCYCGGRALEGKPLLIEKDEVHGAVAQKIPAGEEQYVMVATTSKARYSFDKHEKSVTANDEEVHEMEVLDDAMGEESDASAKSDKHEDSDVEYDVPLRFKQKRGRGRGRAKRSNSCAAPTTSTVLPEYDAQLTATDRINSYLKAAPFTCRRCVMVPRKAYLAINRKRSAETRVIAAKMEDANTRLLLNEHILRSVYYHKTELERQRQQETVKDIAIQKRAPPARRNTIRILNDELKPVEKASCSFPNDDALHIEESTTTRKRRSSPGSEDSGVLGQKRSRLLTTDDSSNGGDVGAGGGIIGDFVDLTENFVDSPEEVEASSSKSHADTTIRMPKITSCFSMHQATASTTSAASKAATTAAFGLGELKLACNNGANSGFRDFYNTVIRNMNNLVGKKMQDIDLALRRESKVIPVPNEEILCIIKWTNFLDAYIEGFVYIWEVKMRDHSFFAATVSKLMPMVVNALGVVNITALDASQLPLMGRMLTQRCRTEATRKLAIVMQGRSTYWLVRGFLRADSSQACVKPTPQSHPLLSTKINLLCSLLIKQRMKEYKRKANVTPQSNQSQSLAQQQQQPTTSRAQQQQQPTTSRAQQQQHPTTSRAQQQPTTSHAQQQQQQSQVQHQQQQQEEEPHAQQQQQQQQPKAQQSNTITQQPNDAVSSPTTASNASAKASTTAFLPHSSSSATLLGKLHAHGYDSMKTNIEFRKLITDDVEEIHPPEYHTDDHRWLVLDLHSDFSHIFVPDFRDLVSLDRIHKVMAFSQQRQKIVKLQFIKNAPYDAFVTPDSSRKIYFGPLKLSQRPPLLILLQSVDGQMMLREIYQRKHNIQCNPQQRTTAFWILQIGGQIHFELRLDDEDNNVNGSETVNIAQKQIEFENSQVDAGSGEAMEQNDESNSRSRDEMEVNNDDSDDEDCMIIEPSSTPTTSIGAGQAEVATSPHLEIPTVPAVPPAILPTFTTDGGQFNVTLLQPTEAQPSLQGENRINFTIERIDDTNKLQITSLPSLTTTQTSAVSAQNMPHGVVTAPNTISYLQPAPTSGFLPLLTLTTPTVIPNVATSSTTAAITTSSQETASYVIISNDSNPTILPANDAAALQLSKTSTSSNSNTNLNQNIDKNRAQPTPPASKSNSPNVATIPTSAELTKPITKRRRTLMSSMRSTNSEKTSNCNISTIGATTITKLSDDTSAGGNSPSPTNINGNKLRSFASITVAKVPTGKGTTSTDTVPVTLNLKDALASATIAKTSTTAIKKSFSGTSSSSTAAAAATATLSNSIKPTIAIGMQSSFNTMHKVVTNKATPPSSSTTTTTYTLNSIPTKSQPLIATKHIHILPAPKRGANMPSQVLNSSGIITTATTTNPITTTSVMNDIAVSAPHNASSGILLTSGAVISSGTKETYSLPSATRLLSIPVTTENTTATSKRVAEKTDVNAGQQGATMRPLIRIRSALRTNEGPPAKIIIGRQPTTVLPTLAATTTAMAPPVISIASPISIAPTTTTTNNRISDKTVITPKTYVAKSLAPRKGNNNNSPEIPTVGSSSMSSAGPVSYGYFHANVPGVPKFVVRRQNETYLVKVRDVGIVQIQTAERVNAYLNRYMAKMEPSLVPQLPINWRFVPQNKTKAPTNEQQKQLHDLEHQKQQSVPSNGNNVPKSIKSNSTSIVLRKILPCTTNTATITTTTKSVQINSNSNSTTMTTAANRNVVNGISTAAAKASRSLVNLPTTDTIIIE